MRYSNSVQPWQRYLHQEEYFPWTWGWSSAIAQALGRPHLHGGVQLWSPVCKEDALTLEQLQPGAAQMGRLLCEKRAGLRQPGEVKAGRGEGFVNTSWGLKTRGETAKEAGGQCWHKKKWRKTEPEYI